MPGMPGADFTHRCRFLLSVAAFCKNRPIILVSVNCSEIAISQIFVLQGQGLCYPPSKKKRQERSKVPVPGSWKRETWGLWLSDAHTSLTLPGLGLGAPHPRLGSYPAALKVRDRVKCTERLHLQPRCRQIVLGGRGCPLSTKEARLLSP